MPPYILIPFAVFMVCCLAQFWLAKQVRDRLIDNHPDKFLEIERSALFPQYDVLRFTLAKGYKDLHDPELDRRVRNLRRLHSLGFLAWLAFAVAIFTAPIQ